ncbi:unnamed protein product [Protopolystoma xenopodis]|uniref:BZIP domain-containing protein n=1 Tax=Protopolystoma xenopodis TaxID=117903 RepID=A0A448XDY4_9PLAT|nr:unnamed protein product [Protopolystoma xenopodis]
MHCSFLPFQNSLDSYEQVDPNQNPGPFDNDFQQEGMLSDSEDTSDVNSSCTNSLQTNPLHIQPFQSPNDRLVESESEGHQATPPSVSRRDREKKLFQAGRDFIKSVQGANQSSLSHHQLRKQKAQTLRMLRQQPMKMTSNSAVKDMVIFSVDSPTFSVSLDASRSPTYSLSGLDHGTCVEKTMERRLRNNEASRRSRAAKKSRFAAMEREAEQLAWQNQRLRIRLKQLNLAAAEAKELLVGKVSLLSTSNGTVKSEA